MLYAERADLRARQITTDALLILWIALWVNAGQWVNEQVQRLGTPPQTLADAGRSIAGVGRDSREVADDIPLVGGALRDLLRPLEGGGRSLVSAGEAGENAANDLALALGLFVAGIPILIAVVRYLVPRLRWMQQASSAKELRDVAGGEALFALRALVHQPLTALRSVAPDPVARYQAGDHTALAELELRRLGLRAASEPGAV